MPRLKKQQSIGEVKVIKDSAFGDLIPGRGTDLGLVVSKLHKISQMFGYQRVETSPVEISDPFGKSKVAKLERRELIRLETESSKKLVLRPHNFFSILRAYLANEIDKKEQTTKWYYVEPSFYSENGTVAYSHEFGMVSFGEPSVISDAHMINMIRTLLDELGILNAEFEVNSKGCENCLPYYHEVLQGYLQQNRYNLCATCQQILSKAGTPQENTQREDLFRVFSCETGSCQEILSSGPQIIDHLDESCNKNFTQLLEALDELDIPYQLNPKLFEDSKFSHILFKVKFPANAEDQSGDVQFGVGGRKNLYVERLRGQPLPTLEFSIDLNKLLNLTNIHGQTKKLDQIADVYLINLGGMAVKKSLRLFRDLWKNNISVAEQFGENGIKNQFRLAAEKGCHLALVVGQKEAMEGTVILRDVRSGMQEVFAADRIIEEVKKRLQE
ncbi:MAG: hypothetical protein COT91_04715 [Candidatus Doudnabacteria bacterium CG10_big_fil_rev_8_21_14_0_10_41_10]|uniref:histidine--tRNA ligase n=1 Tax=Candidatus Doudnabacteria bacterium CG10_big_fil_rev_8_21_14_0_10_41_10 TaxID=1974551 RepID=A0A2H0VCF6_9BACT|nr:MAG: hypothetical protein COT91_04715 [Candidatus Doudnabacteria bacterium CG10_big_fil_rev_8_21_14_0_10_41_10]